MRDDLTIFQVQKFISKFMKEYLPHKLESILEFNDDIFIFGSRDVQREEERSEERKINKFGF
jgi:hypothetical protein